MEVHIKIHGQTVSVEVSVEVGEWRDIIEVQRSNTQDVIESRKE